MIKEFGHLNVPKKKNYKTDDTWLRAVWRKNKEYLSNIVGDYKTFKVATKSYVEAGDASTVRQGLKLLTRTIDKRTGEPGFLRRGELETSLIEKGMKGHKRTFKAITGEKFDAEKVKWNSAKKQFEYRKDDGTLVASFSDPKKVGLSKMAKKGISWVIY